MKKHNKELEEDIAYYSDMLETSISLGCIPTIVEYTKLLNKAKDKLQEAQENYE